MLHGDIQWLAACLPSDFRLFFFSPLGDLSASEPWVNGMPDRGWSVLTSLHRPSSKMEMAPMDLGTRFWYLENRSQVHKIIKIMEMRDWSGWQVHLGFFSFEDLTTFIEGWNGILLQEEKGVGEGFECFSRYVAGHCWLCKFQDVPEQFLSNRKRMEKGWKFAKDD